MYKCECGKEFDNPQSFNGHKSHCEIHLNSAGKADIKERLKQSLKLAGKKANKINHEKAELKKLEELTKWISEQHTCEKCGKVMTSKFGSGRFCSKVCANSHLKSTEAKLKISLSLKNNKNRKIILKQEKFKETYLKNPKICPICNHIISYEKRKRIFCSDNCENIFHSKKAKEHHLGGITKGHGSGIAGKYKGIKCDSKYELAFLVYCLENNINIKRNKKAFKYVSFDAKLHNFYPDFYLENENKYIEIKGYYQTNTPYKINAMQNQNINFEILYWEDLEKCFKYIKDKFNLSYATLEKLYDK